MTAFIDAHRARFGVEPICRVLQFAPSTYYAAKARTPSARARRHEALAAKVEAAWKANFEVYGRRKLWAELRRQGETAGRDQVERVMKSLGIAGAVRGRRVRTTRPDPAAGRAPDLVNRQFTAPAPNRLWVADFTVVPTWSGQVYMAFVIDVYSRMIVGWRASTNMRTALVLDALEMAIWRRDDLAEGLVAHSDAGSQYTSIAYTGRLGEIGAAPSIGSVGDSYDNALAESTIGLYKTELIRPRGPWRTVEQVELGTLEYVDWWNHRRLHSEIGNLPPAELEARYYAQLATKNLATTQ